MKFILSMAILGHFISFFGIQHLQAAELINGQRIESVIERVGQIPRPRSWADRDERAKIFQSLRAGARSGAFQRLLVRVNTERVRNETSALLQGATPNNASGLLSQKQSIDFEMRQTQSAAFAWLVSGDPAMRAEARLRVLALSQLDPNGSTSVAGDMLSARHIAWTVALVHDWMYDEFTAEERGALVRAASVRVADFHRHVTTGKTAFDLWPWDSRANEALGGMLEAAMLLVGETTASELWVRDLLPLYLRTTMVWAGDDGGFANGTAYAGWDIGEYSLRHWDALRRMLGIDLRQKSWVQNFGRFLTYFLPPGTPTGLFGDGAEARMPEVWARYAKAYAYRVPEPLYRWYARQWFQEDVTALELLTAPLTDLDIHELPTGTPDSASFPSVGWVAMHSDLRDRARTSLYFKSSPFGSLNHSHADQNSFVLNVAGDALLIDSGYYDSYNSPHQRAWGRQTAAHNAITFDAGQGQVLDKKDASGTLRSFSHTQKIDVAVGDATESYGGKLSQAVRTVIYFRPDIFVIVDHLKSVTPRQWEWNLHARSPFSPAGGDTLVVASGNAQACISTFADQAFSQHQWQGFPVRPTIDARDRRPDQAHARWQTNSRTTGARVAQVIRINCNPREISVSFRADGTTLIESGNTGALVSDSSARVSVKSSSVGK